MCVYIELECAVCVRVMFNNHYNKFLAYTSQIWPVKRGIPKSYDFVLTEIACKRKPEIQADLEELILEILAHIPLPIEKFLPLPRKIPRASL